MSRSSPTWWGSPPLCPACLSSTGCRRTALDELPECAAATTSQTSLWPVGVSYMLDNTCIEEKKKRIYKKTKGRDIGMVGGGGSWHAHSPWVVFSKCLHRGEELGAFPQSHGGFLLLGLEHALVLLIGLHTTHAHKHQQASRTSCHRILLLSFDLLTSASCSS